MNGRLSRFQLPIPPKHKHLIVQLLPGHVFPCTPLASATFFAQSAPSSSVRGVAATGCGWCSSCIVSETLAGLDQTGQWAARAQRRRPSSVATHPELPCRVTWLMVLPSLPPPSFPSALIPGKAGTKLSPCGFPAICSFRVSHSSLRLFLDGVHRLPQLIPRIVVHEHVHAPNHV